MLDFGFSELIVIIALAVLVIGPKELPGIMRLLGTVFRRLSYIKYAMSQQFEDFMRDADLDDIRNSVNFETRRRDRSDRDVNQDEIIEEFDEAAEDADVMEPIEDKREEGKIDAS